MTTGSSVNSQSSDQASVGWTHVDRYISDREADGWTRVFVARHPGHSIGREYSEVRDWMTENIGQQLESTNWGDPGDATWEDLGDNEFFVRHAKDAVMVKLKWG